MNSRLRRNNTLVLYDRVSKVELNSRPSNAKDHVATPREPCPTNSDGSTGNEVLISESDKPLLQVYKGQLKLRITKEIDDVSINGFYTFIIIYLYIVNLQTVKYSHYSIILLQEYKI